MSFHNDGRISTEVLTFQVFWHHRVLQNHLQNQLRTVPRELEKQPKIQRQYINRRARVTIKLNDTERKSNQINMF
jgi:hypothetical protein